jgi:hypothetical protein
MTDKQKQSDPQSRKPSWFELVDGDAPSAQVVKVNKKLPLIALFLTGTIAASGAFFAHASDGNASTAVAATPTATATPDANSVIALSTSAPQSPTVKDPSQGGIQAPGVGHDDDDDREGHEGREGHERGERDHDEDD